MVNKLYEESNSKDNRIQELESKLETIKSELVTMQSQFTYVTSLQESKTEDGSNSADDPKEVVEPTAIE